MQQAVTSTQVSLSTSSASIMVSSLLFEFIERHAVKLRRFDMATLRTWLAELLNERTTSAVHEKPATVTASTSEQQVASMLDGLKQMLKRPDIAPLVAIDPLIEPIVFEQNRSFFENKHGFGEHELSRPWEYREPLTSRQRKNFLNSIHSLGSYYKTFK